MFNLEELNWELPAYVEHIYRQRKHKHALVIPVINEGERIRNQLLKIKELNLPIDVIIADGGSSDGSVTHNFLKTAGVTALLTKTGPGKLGAQLRIAYAWCINQGYDGIVTIDGNGKDGVEAVANMILHLEERFDYVQGSRYRKGGKAENTPFGRTIGNRFIHAPIISFAGRRWLTDTTNGFRAYSKKYLIDPRVQPFRDIFNNYELLFYLSIRAGQLGFKVGETAVERSYPKCGSTPTKINGFKGKIDILIQLYKAATGAYNP